MAARTKEVVVQDEAPAALDFAGAQSLEQALAVLAAGGIEVEDITDHGDGFLLMPSTFKAELVGKPFVIADGRIVTDKDTDREYVSLKIVVPNSAGIDRYIINDGSQGIYAQCKMIGAKRGTLAGLVVKGGLSGGEYTTTLPSGEKVVASTFYFAGV